MGLLRSYYASPLEGNRTPIPCYNGSLCDNTTHIIERDGTMSTDQNKQTLQRFYEEVWHAANPAYDQYLAPEAASYRQQIEGLKAEYPDIHFDLGEVVAEGDTVVAVWTSQAVPGAEGISIWHFKDGKITDRTAYRRDLA